MNKRGKITDTIRIEIIEDYLSSGASKSSIARKYNIGDADTIRLWMKRMGIKDPYKRELSIPIPDMKAKSYKKVSKDDTSKEYEARISELEKELFKANMKKDFYRTMVDIAEKEFKIDIRKKSGTKQ